jgi:hypothetical protein
VSTLVLYLLQHFPAAGLAVLFVLTTFRPRSVAMLAAVLTALIGRDEKQSRPERAIAIVEALAGGRNRGARPKDEERKPLELPPGPPR